MRILIATQHLQVVGGVETYLRALIPLLLTEGCELGVVVGQGDGAGEVLSGADAVRVWPAAGRSVADVVVDVAAWRPEVVYSQGLEDPGLEEALVDRFPVVLFAHNYFGTCVSGTKCQSRRGYRSCDRVLGAGCLASYFPYGCGGRNPLSMLRLYRVQRRRQSLLSRFAAVLVASRRMADEYRRHGVAEDQLRVVPLFPTDVTPDAGQPIARPQSNRVLFVGRITALKGLRHLIEALPFASSELGRALTLVVAGDGPDRPEVEAQAARQNVPAEFLGWVGGERRQAEMRRADALTIPSLWPEPFGLVGVEAGCVGLPAVGYASGGIPDWLIPGVTGESAPGGRPDAVELASALCRALRDNAHRHRLGTGAWEMARRFDAGAHVRSLIETLKVAATSGRL